MLIKQLKIYIPLGIWAFLYELKNILRFILYFSQLDYQTTFQKPIVSSRENNKMKSWLFIHIIYQIYDCLRMLSFFLIFLNLIILINWQKNPRYDSFCNVIDLIDNYLHVSIIFGKNRYFSNLMKTSLSSSLLNHRNFENLRHDNTILFPLIHILIYATNRK